MPLFHLHSKVLDGFYQSDVYVAAPNVEAAKELAFDAFTMWLDRQLAEYHFFPLGRCHDPDDEDFGAARSEVIKSFNEELAGLTLVVGGAAICRKT